MKSAGYISRNIRKAFFWENVRKAFIWENIGKDFPWENIIFLILEWESFISRNVRNFFRGGFFFLEEGGGGGGGGGGGIGLGSALGGPKNHHLCKNY